LAFFFNFEEKTPTPDQLTAEDWGIHWELEILNKSIGLLHFVATWDSLVKMLINMVCTYIYMT
jgi:hypothetical protein